MSTSTPSPDDREGLRFSPWNLLLLLPFLMLVTPWINFAEPRLFGILDVDDREALGAVRDVGVGARDVEPVGMRAPEVCSCPR